MTTDNLTDDDRAVLEYLEHDTTIDDPDERIARLEQENQELKEIVLDQGDELNALRETVKDLTSTVTDIQAYTEGRDPTDPRSGNYYENLTILEKYASMSEEEREELLSGNASKLRAVTIFENWQDWSQPGARDRSEQLISTLHTRGRYNKIAVKVDLQSARDEELQNIEVYRAMKAVAKLSVTETEEAECTTDTYGREHITGGAFEFHEKVNEDNSKHFKVLKLVDPDGVTFP